MLTFGHGLFSYEAGTRTFATEMSTLEANAGGRAVFGRIYDDACDAGFAIMGKIQPVRFYLDNAVRDDEGEVLYWILRATTDDIGYEKPIKCLVYND